MLVCAGLGLTFGLVCFFVEGIYLSQLGDAIPLWAAAVHLGAAAPIVLALGGIAGLFLPPWLERYPAWRRPIRELWRLLTGGAPDVARRRSARLHAAAVLSVVALVAATLGSSHLLTSIRTPAFAAAAILLVGLVFAAFACLAAPRMVGWCDRALGLLERLPVIGGALVRPISTVAAGALAVVAGLVLLWLRAPDIFAGLPWNLALGPALAAAVTLAAARPVLGARVSRAGVFGAVGLSLTLGLAALAVWLPAPMQRARGIFFEGTSLPGALVGRLEAKLDSDGDGATAYFGGGDCAPDDPKIGPHAREIIDNSIDENCSGSDLTVPEASFAAGPSHHDRPEGSRDRPHIVLITTDALSFGHTGAGGYERDVTPNFDAWAGRATVFEYAFSTAPSTRLAWPGFLASRFNATVPMRNRRVHPYPLEDSLPTLFTVLEKRGYRTVHIPGARYFYQRRWKYAHGADLVDEKANEAADNPRHSAPSLTDAALQHVRDASADEPLFLWVHYYDHHGPYQVPAGEEAFGDEPVDLYDTELRFTDRHWGRLIRGIEEAWEPEDYMVVFTSDHGEAFDENHDRHHHGYTLQTPELHVPLVIQGSRNRGRRIDGLAGHVDILPTLASLVDAKPDPNWRGESLVPALFEPQGRPQKTALFELMYIPEDARRQKDGFRKIGVRTDEWHYIEDLRKNKRRLVRWKTDPLESADRCEEFRTICEIYRYVASRELERLREREDALSHLRKEKKKRNHKKKNDKSRKKKK